MPGPDEIRRYQEEHPVSPEFKAMIEGLPEVKYDPAVMRQRLQEQFAQFARKPCQPPSAPASTSESMP